MAIEILCPHCGEPIKLSRSGETIEAEALPKRTAPAPDDENEILAKIIDKGAGNVG